MITRTPEELEEKSQTVSPDVKVVARDSSASSAQKIEKSKPEISVSGGISSHNLHARTAQVRKSDDSIKDGDLSFIKNDQTVKETKTGSDDVAAKLPAVANEDTELVEVEGNNTLPTATAETSVTKPEENILPVAEDKIPEKAVAAIESREIVEGLKIKAHTLEDVIGKDGRTEKTVHKGDVSENDSTSELDYEEDDSKNDNIMDDKLDEIKLDKSSDDEKTSGVTIIDQSKLSSDLSEENKSVSTLSGLSDDSAKVHLASSQVGSEAGSASVPLNSSAATSNIDGLNIVKSTKTASELGIKLDQSVSVPKTNLVESVDSEISKEEGKAAIMIEATLTPEQVKKKSLKLVFDILISLLFFAIIGFAGYKYLWPLIQELMTGM